MVHNIELRKRITSFILVLVMVLTMLPSTSLTAFAAADDNLCEHHTEHSADCHYAEAVAGSPCTHAHSEDCYAIVSCLHTCGDDCAQGCSHECTVESGCIVMEHDCRHTHGDCGYSEGTAEVPCGHVHDESCGYVAEVAEVLCGCIETDESGDLVHTEGCGYAAPVEGQPCGHTEHTDCGYAPATEGTPCTHVCEVRVNSSASCYKLLCSHKDGGHDDACGYVAAVEGHECHYECAECAEDESTDVGDGSPVPESAAADEDNGTEDPSPAECDCGTDDASVHATSCPAYVAPENPVCSCAEKCVEANVWCDVCGFDVTACEGEDTAAVYEESITLTGFDYEISGSSVILTKYTGSDTAVTVADSYTIDGTAYTTVLDTATVFKGNTAITSVTIGSGVGFKDNTMAFLFYGCHALATVDMSGVDTSKVTSLESVFDECKVLTTITGYENWDTSNVTSMFHTFDQTNALTKVDLSKWDLSKVENTGWCFQQCYATEILLPDNIKTISAGFMNHASKVTGTSFTIPSGVQKIGYAHTFYDFATDSFTEFKVAEGNSNYKAEDGILYSADGTELLAIPRGKTFTNGVYTVPEGVTFMGELSFSRNKNITTVVLPDSFVIKSYDVKDPDYIVYEDTGNINVGTNLTMAIYTFVPVANYAVNDTNPNYTAVDGIIYNKEKTEVVAIPTQYGRAIEIPEGVTTWNEQALWNDTEVSNVDNLSNTVNKLLLTIGSISLPSTLTKIEDGQLALLNRLATGDSFTITVAEGNTAYQLVDGQLVKKAECTCETKCAEGSVNSECAVCSKEGADLSQCIGTAQQEETITLYFANTGGWSTVYAYYWSDSNTQMIVWPGAEMTLVDGETIIYSIAVPEMATMVIFNDGSAATDDLTIPTSGSNLYTYGAGSDAVWSYYNPCKHTGKITYTYDADNHTGVCDDCGETVTKGEAHSYTEGVCICGARAVAKIGENYYLTFSEAAAAVTGGQTIVLLDDVTIAEGETLAFNAWAELDVGEHIITCNGTVTIGESDGIIFENALYYYGGDVTERDSAVCVEEEATYYKAGDGYILSTYDSASNTVTWIMNQATINVSTDHAIVSDLYSLHIYFRGENFIIDNSDSGSTAIQLNFHSNGSQSLILSGTEDAVLNITASEAENSFSYGIQAKDVTVNGGTVNVTSGNANSFSAAIYATEAAGIKVNAGATLNLTFGKTETSSPACGTMNNISGEGTVNGLVLQMDGTATTVAYTAYGSTVLVADFTPLTDESTTTTFTVPEGASLTVNEGVTVDLSAMAVDSIDFSGTVTNNGTIKLPADFALDNAPKGGAVYIGEAFYVWNSEKSKWVCGGTHTGGTATCTTLAVCELCGESYGEYAHSFVGESCSACGQPKTYAITYYIYGNGTVEGPEAAAKDETVTLIITPDTGYMISYVTPCYMVNVGTDYEYSANIEMTGLSFTMVGSEVTIHVRFKACDHSGNTNKASDNGDGTHTFTCSACGLEVTEEHEGQGTCIAPAKCDGCGVVCGELDLTNHDETLGPEGYTDGYCNVCEALQPCQGSGTAEDPYLIGNTGNLYWFAEKVNGGDTGICGKLTADIVVNKNVLASDGSLNAGTYRSWTPIGSYKYQYSGTFDGDGHTVSGLYFNNSSDTAVGLFGEISGGTICNVGVVDSYFYAFYYIGAVVAKVKDGGTVTNCYSNATVKGTSMMGGIVGELFGTVTGCYNTGKVNAVRNYVGGVVGNNQGTVTNCCYLTGCATGFGYAQYGIGSSSGAPVADVEGSTAGCSDFSTGEACYLLNGGVTDGTQAWYQTCGEGMPAFAGKTVYYGYLSCSAEAIMEYTNIPVTAERPAHGESVIYIANEDGTHYGIYECCGDSYVENESHSYADGKCEYCAYVCTHPTHGTDGKCTDCGLAMEHTYDDNGFCTVCDGYQSAVLNGDVYEISNAGQLYWFAEKVNNKNAAIKGKLTDDIVVNENLMDKLTITDGVATVNEGVTLREWTPISDSNAIHYRGTFDGDGHTVSGLYFNDPTVQYVGLLGYTSNAKVLNVGVVDSYIYGNDSVGGVVGYAYSGTIANCYNTGIVNGGHNVGGVVGASHVKDSTVTNCYNTGAIFGSKNSIGGVAGLHSGTMTNCYNTGSVNGGNFVGGVAGDNFLNSLVTDCYNTGTITGEGVNIGSVVGNNQDTVTNCYYLTGSATSSGGTVQYGIGAYSGSRQDVEGSTAAYSDFSTGEVCYLLNGGVTDGTQAFYQTCGEGIPVFAGKTVYYGYTCCHDTEKIYTNYSVVYEEPLSHSYDSNGFCTNLLTDGSTVCDAYEPAVLNDEVYEISNAGQLYWFAAKVNNGDNAINGKLMKDIVVNEGTLSENSTDVRHWTPIGVWASAEENQIPFNGTFDGNYHTVSGLYMNSGLYMGMFDMIGTQSTVQNLGVVNCYFGYENARVGSLAFRNNGTVTNCYRLGGTVVGIMVGGLVAYNGGSLTDCYASGTTRTLKSRGGLVVSNAGTITNCYTACDTKVYYNNSGTVDELTAYKTTAQFASGEVAYLLGEPFGQTIGTDSYPVFNGETVYKMVSAPCVTTVGYTNDPDETLSVAHSYENGFCTNTLQTGELCDEYEPCTGSGTAEDPYLIANGGNLYWFAAQVNGGDTDICGKLTDNIVVNEGTMSADSTDVRAWTPIGNYSNKYTGTFDGDGKTISGLYFNDSAVDYVGLFGRVNGGTVKNVGVIDSYLSGSNRYVGGVVGYNYYGTVTNSYNTGNVSGSYLVGGVAGYNSNGTVTNCYNTGTVSGSNYHVGGVAGYNYGTVTNCYYLTGCATDGIATQYGIGASSIGNTIADVAGSTTGYSDFSTGEVCYLLNGGVTDGTQAFYQTCDEGTPVFAGETVYCGYTCCYDTEKIYTNSSAVYENALPHSYENGFCTNLRTDGETVCGTHEPATLVTADNYEALELTEGYVDYYAIANAGQLMWFAEYVNSGNFTACGVLTADINMNGVKWTPIGTATAYTGTFDGRGKTISNLWQNSGVGNGNRDGLFVTVGSGGVVTNVILDNATIWGASLYGTNGCGGIAIRNAGTISKCMVTNSGLQQGAYEYLGGIAGVNSGTIENCAVVNCAFTRRWGGSSSGTMGGITQTNNGSVINCHSYGCSFNNGRADKAAVVALGTAPENCYYYTTSAVATTYATAMTVDQFSSGEVCYLLNGDQSNIVWKQMAYTDPYPTFVGEVVTKGDSEEYPYYNADIISVDISWTAMHYTFTPGEVDAETGETTADAWIVDEGGGTITVTSYGGKMAAVGFTFEPTMGGVSGSFDVEKAVLAQGRSVTATLTVTGQPEEVGFVNKQIGTATVTLGKSDWTVDDTVTVYAKDGENYNATVVEVTDSKAVLATGIVDTFLYQFEKGDYQGLADDLQTNYFDAVGSRLPQHSGGEWSKIIVPYLTANTRNKILVNRDGN